MGPAREPGAHGQLGGPGDGPGVSGDGHLLFFASRRAAAGDLNIYLSHRDNPTDDFGWGSPVALEEGVINTPGGEAGADYLANAEEGGGNLYFNRMPLGGNWDLFHTSIARDGASRSAAVPIAELSHPTANEQGPTLRGDAREIYFFSNRVGGVGGNDFWVSTRQSIAHPWSAPVNAGAPVNSTGSEQQPSLSADGRTLVFASNRAGSLGGTDIWIARRTIGGQ